MSFNKSPTVLGVSYRAPDCWKCLGLKPVCASAAWLSLQSAPQPNLRRRRRKEAVSFSKLRNQLKKRRDEVNWMFIPPFINNDLTWGAPWTVPQAQ